MVKFVFCRLLIMLTNFGILFTIEDFAINLSCYKIVTIKLKFCYFTVKN